MPDGYAVPSAPTVTPASWVIGEPLRRRTVDLVDGAAATLAATLPTTGATLDQLWRTARRRTRRAFAAAPHLRAHDLARHQPAMIRNSSRAVIVGSGPSALLTRKPEWADLLGTADVFALNHAAAIAPALRFCSIEVPDLMGRQASLSAQEGLEFLEWAVSSARTNAPDTIVLIRASSFDRATLELAARVERAGTTTELAMQAALSVRGRTAPERFARWLAARGALRWPSAQEPFISTRGGLGFLICLCIALGYEEITLFGVDLYSDLYWFDSVDDAAAFPGLDRFRSRLAAPSGRPHATASATGDRPGIIEALVAIQRHVLVPSGRTLRVAGDRSLLRPLLPHAVLL